MFEPSATSLLQRDLSTFQCARDNDVERFLKTKAIDFERRNLSRTFLVIDADCSADYGLTILAYFSLAISLMRVGNEVTRKIKDQLNYQVKRPTIPCYLIGQMAKSDTYSEHLTGSEVLNLAMGFLAEAQRNVAGCCVRVDCKKHEKIMRFYENSLVAKLVQCIQAGTFVRSGDEATMLTTRRVSDRFGHELRDIVSDDQERPMEMTCQLIMEISGQPIFRLEFEFCNSAENNGFRFLQMSEDGALCQMIKLLIPVSASDDRTQYGE